MVTTGDTVVEAATEDRDEPAGKVPTVESVEYTAVTLGVSFPPRGAGGDAALGTPADRGATVTEAALVARELAAAAVSAAPPVPAVSPEAAGAAVFSLEGTVSVTGTFVVMVLVTHSSPEQDTAVLVTGLCVDVISTSEHESSSHSVTVIVSVLRSETVATSVVSGVVGVTPVNGQYVVVMVTT